MPETVAAHDVDAHLGEEMAEGDTLTILFEDYTATVTVEEVRKNGE